MKCSSKTSSLPGSGSAVLEVFNSLGEKVAEPLNRYLNAGYHRVSFDGKNLSAGIYFYRIKASYGSRTKEVMITRKMTLIK